MIEVNEAKITGRFFVSKKTGPHYIVMVMAYDAEGRECPKKATCLFGFEKRKTANRVADGFNKVMEQVQ